MDVNLWVVCGFCLIATIAMCIIAEAWQRWDDRRMIQRYEAEQYAEYVREIEGEPITEEQLREWNLGRWD